MGCRQAACKERMYQQAKAKRIRKILCRNAKRVQEFEVQEAMPTTQQLKDAFNLRMKNTSEEQQEEAKISF
jgi:hypothetical protein